MYKNNRAVTIITMVITIVIMIILVAVSINIGKKIISQSQLEDIKTNMLAIQGKTKIIAEKNAFNKKQPLEGIKIEKSSNYQADSFVISNDLKAKLDKDVYYIWGEWELQQAGLNNIKTDEKEFYIVEYKSGEVLYSLGYTGQYKLSELNDM